MTTLEKFQELAKIKFMSRTFAWRDRRAWYELQTADGYELLHYITQLMYTI